MLKTGTVATVTPTQAGGYQHVTAGWIYTFDMVVNTAEGQVGGEIGSKTQQYPVGPGQPITVDVTSGQYGPKLKKVNPQYQQQGQPQGPTQLNPQTQAIINEARNRSPQQAAGAIQDHMAGPVNPIDPTSNVPDRPIPSPQDYAAKEREKVLGMCFTNILAGRMAAIPASELEKDLAEIAAMWRLAAMCIDGTGRVGDTPNF